MEISGFRMLLYNGQHIEGDDGMLTATEFFGTSKSGQDIRLKRDEIKLLDVAGKSRTGKYAGIGALSGLVTAGLAILQVEADPELELNSERVVPITTALVGAGALIGALIGSQSTEWNNIPLNSSVGMSNDGKGLAFAMKISF